MRVGGLGGAGGLWEGPPFLCKDGWGNTLRAEPRWTDIEQLFRRWENSLSGACVHPKRACTEVLAVNRT